MTKIAIFKNFGKQLYTIDFACYSFYLFQRNHNINKYGRYLHFLNIRVTEAYILKRDIIVSLLFAIFETQ